MPDGMTQPALVTEPGIYSHLTNEQYHGEPCDGPSLGSTGARKIINDCPAAFRFSPPETKEEFDIGNAAHLLVLQPEEFEARIGRVPLDDYRKKEAQVSRDDIRASGRIPLTYKQVADVEAMRASIFAHPIASLAFRDGAPEQSIFWRDPDYGFWGKTRPDWLPTHRRYLVDIKTSMSADPEEFKKAIYNFGYAQQAEWYMTGVEQVLGVRPERFCFVVVSKKPPYLVSVFWLDEDSIEWGRILNRRARGVFAWCLKHDRWPSYAPDIFGPPAAFTVGLPEWAVRDLQRRHESGEFEPPELERADFLA